MVTLDKGDNSKETINMANSNPTASWKKGQSGNPKGRPKRDWTWSSVLQTAMEDSAKDGISIKIHVAQALVKEALTGNIQAIKELMNRMDGMPQQPTDITSGGRTLPAPIYGSRSSK